jgi:tripartite ATP-independent transporter DctM subunit
MRGPAVGAVDGLFKAVEAVLALLLVAMVVMVFGNVVLRYAFNSGISVSEEMSRFCFVWLTFIGAIVAMRDGSHLGMDTFVSKMSRRGKLICLTICQGLILLCCADAVLGHLAPARSQRDDGGASHRHVDDLDLRCRLPDQRLHRAARAAQAVAHRQRCDHGCRADRDQRERRGRARGPGEQAMTVAVFAFSLLGTMALGLPIAFALLICGAALMVWQGQIDTTILSQKLLEGADSFPLLAIPFFMLAGELMNAGGISKRIVNFALSWVGHLRGGLGHVAIFASVVMAAISGSAAADAAAIGAMLIPMMRRAGYDVPRASGLIAAGGVIAPVIPPSIGLIVFGVIANVSIGKLFLAGIFPGLLMGLSLLITWQWVARRDKVSVLPRQPLSERLRTGVDGIWALLMPAGIIGGLKFGVFTPTEAGVAACVYAFVLGVFVYRELHLRDVYGLLVAAAKSTAVVVFLIAAALVSAWLITTSEVPQQVAAILKPFMFDKTVLMLVIMVLVVVVGTALDFAPTLMILTPVLMPVIKEAGIDPVYFGVLFIMNNAIGLITPPVGIVLNVICGVSKISMKDLMRGLWPFLWAELIVLLLLVLFPALVMVPLKWFS